MLQSFWGVGGGVRACLSNNQQGERQQIARLSRLAIATTSERKLKKTQTKEFPCRNRANERSWHGFLAKMSGGKLVP